MRGFDDADVLLDMRCLQDPSYATRGIGRHSLNLIRHAPRPVGRRLIGIVDPEMPPLAAETRAMLDDVRTHAYTGSLDRPSYFIQLSPMTHDPLFTVRLVHSRAIRKAAVIYDFIPMEDQARYLPTAALRVDYHLNLCWLARYDHFLPISEIAASRLRGLLAVEAERTTVTGAPLDPSFETVRPSAKASHVLVVGGDWRKNAECAVRGHAQARLLQLARVPIVITGGYAADNAGVLRELARTHGGDPALLRIEPHVTDETLRELYRHAFCVVVASRAEGFSLPVIEAMACGAPAISSDIPAHRELIADTDVLFAPEDDGAVAAILDRLAREPAWRETIRDEQRQMWPRFTAARVAARFWDALELHVLTERLSAPAALRRRRPRIAFLSPLPPSRTGVADHTAASIAELGKKVELHVFTETERPAPLEAAAAVCPLSPVPFLSTDFDRVVAVVGNSDFHVSILDHLLRFGGAAIAHDGRMTDFYWHLRGPERASAQASRELGRPVCQEEVWRWLHEPNTLETLFLGEIARAADPLCVHSAPSARLIEQKYGVGVVHLPFCIQRGWPPDGLSPGRRARARAALGIADGEIVIVTFGSVHHTKASEDCVWSVDVLRSWGFPVAFAFVGGNAMDTAPLRALVGRLGLESCIRFQSDYTDEATYHNWLLAADLGLQLRTFTFGSISGALMDCVTAGLPTVANRDLADSLDAPSYVRRIGDSFNPVLAAEALAELIDSGALPRRTEAERLAYVDQHSPHVYADTLLIALGLVP